MFKTRLSIVYKVKLLLVVRLFLIKGLLFKK